MTGAAEKSQAGSLRRMLVPLALAQFICSFAGSNMNVMITSIKDDLHTTVQGVQVCITLFLLVMAALMIPCGKLTARWGRKRCFVIGLYIYGHRPGPETSLRVAGPVVHPHVSAPRGRRDGADMPVDRDCLDAFQSAIGFSVPRCIWRPRMSTRSNS